jgi:uncharacterized protein with NRDE domain
MCTVSWFFQSDGFQLFVNRDERHNRPIALPPAWKIVAGVRVLAPTDPQGGGTWAGVNEFGLAVALLNRYQDSALENPPFLSRGQIALNALAQPDLGALATWLPQQNLQQVQPFSLLALQTEKQPHVWDWNGKLLSLRPTVSPPLVSSAVHWQAVTAFRTTLYAQIVPVGSGEKEHMSYHRWFEGEPNGFSVRMWRPDAATVSFSQIVVQGKQVSYSYESADGVAESGSAVDSELRAVLCPPFNRQFD